MSSFTKYTLLDMSDPSLAQQVATDVTEGLFCGFAVEPIYVALIQEGGQPADEFDRSLYKFISSLSKQCKGDKTAPSHMWEALQDRSILKGIVTALSKYVRSLAAYRSAKAADAEIGYLISFQEADVKGDAPTTPRVQSAPKFSLDSTTVQALVDRKAYEGLTMASYTKILKHKSYFENVSDMLLDVLWAYKQRIKSAIEQDASLWRNRKLSAWAALIAEVPPHLIRFTPYTPGRNSGVWSLFKSKKDQLRPGFVRMHWVCGGRDRHLDISERIVDVTRAAIATAPKVPYLASEWASNVPLFVNPDIYDERRVQGAPVPEDVASSWYFEKRRDYRACDPIGF